MKIKTSKWKTAATICLLAQASYAQVPEYSWADGLNAVSGIPGNIPTSTVYSVATDPYGNVYSTGYAAGIIDYDPGPGVYNLGTPADGGTFIRKLDANGNFLWAHLIDADAGHGITADAAGVYITGIFNGTVDFNPGAGTNTLTSAGGSDIYVLSLSSSGNYIGAYRAGGTGSDRGIAIATRGGNLYIIGTFAGSFDADPTIVGTSIITSNGGTDICILKITQSGGFSWARAFGSTANDANSAPIGKDDINIAINQANGEIYTTGFLAGTADIDPTAGITTLTGAGTFTMKLTNAGAFVWGSQTTTCVGRGICLDNAGNVFTTGRFTNSPDFDPGPGSAPLTAAGSSDLFVRKLDAAGNFVWAKRIGASGSYTEGYDITCGPSGNVYITGGFSGTVDFDPSPASTANITAGGSSDPLISGLDNNGNYLWAKNISGADYGRGYDIAADYADAVYTCGDFKNSADFNTEGGTYTMPLAGEVSSLVQDGYLHKLVAVCESTPTDPGFEWATDVGGTGFAYTQAVETDASGNVYSAGHFNGTVDFDPSAGMYLVSPVDEYDAFVQKQDAAGNLLWVKIIAGKGSEYALSLSLDNSGNVAVAGMFNDDIDIDPGAAVNTIYTNGVEDIYVIKLDPSGNFIWGNRIGGTGADYCYGIKFDGSGDLGCTGAFSGTVDFDPGVINVSRTSAGLLDAFVLKLGSGGNFLWSYQAGGTSSESGRSICFDAANHVFVCGVFAGSTDFNYGSTPSVSTSAGNDDGFVVRLINTGAFNWVKKIAGTGVERANAIAFDSQYNFLYITGLFTGTCNINGTTLTSNGTDDSYLLKMNTIGANAWVKQIGNTSGAVYTQALATDACGDVYVTGYYISTCDFDPNATTYNLSSVSGTTDAFIFKLQHTSQFCWAKSMGGNAADRGYGIDVDAAASVYTAGHFQATADFDPGSNTANLGSVSIDGFVQKLNTSLPVRNFTTFSEPVVQPDTRNTITLFPNPTDGQFNIRFARNTTGEVMVSDITGHLLLSVKLNSSLQEVIDLRGYAKGIYLVTVTDDMHTETQRLIIR